MNRWQRSLFQFYTVYGNFFLFEIFFSRTHLEDIKATFIIRWAKNFTVHLSFVYGVSFDRTNVKFSHYLRQLGLDCVSCSALLFSQYCYSDSTRIYWIYNNIIHFLNRKFIVGHKQSQKKDRQTGNIFIGTHCIYSIRFLPKPDHSVILTSSRYKWVNLEVLFLFCLMMSQELIGRKSLLVMYFHL